MKNRIPKSILIIVLWVLLCVMASCSGPSPDTKAQVQPQQQVPASQPPASAQPKPKIIESFRFVVMADSRGIDKGVNSVEVKKTMEALKKLTPQPVFAVMPGDLVDGSKTYKGVKQQLEYFKKLVTQYYPAEFFYPGLGNHETAYDSGGEKAFGEVFTEFEAGFLQDYGRTVYFFDHGNARIFMLNSNYPGERHIISDKQLEWVRDNLDETKSHNIFFVHEPPYPTGSHVGSALDSNRLQRNKLWSVVDSSQSSMLFCGHEHNYTRRHINSDFNETVGGVEFKYEQSVYQVTAGSFGAPLYTKYTSKKNVDIPPVAQYHFAVVDIDDSVKVKVYNLEGEVLDEFEQSKQ